MRISAINNGYDAANKKCSKQSFKGLIKGKNVKPVISNMSQSDILELKQIEQRLSKTKFWDLKISGAGSNFNDFKFEFIDKTKKHGIITGGIYPYDVRENTIKVYSIIYGPANISNNVVETLRYKSNSRANIVYNKYMQNMESVRHRNFNLTPIESLKNKEIELNMLEEASHFAEESDKSNLVNTEIVTKANVGNSFKKI